MFTPEERTGLRDALVAAARADPRITAAALTGSAAAGAEDRWSDIDLALSVAADADRGRVVADWTDRVYREGGAVHHLDVYLGDTLFRVFLLADTLQVDIAFWPEAEFGAYGPSFRLLFGTANERPHRPPPDAAGLIGVGWLYALHARSSIERGRAWQAGYMGSGMRGPVHPHFYAIAPGGQDESTEMTPDRRPHVAGRRPAAHNVRRTPTPSPEATA